MNALGLALITGDSTVEFTSQCTVLIRVAGVRSAPSDARPLYQLTVEAEQTNGARPLLTAAFQPTAPKGWTVADEPVQGWAPDVRLFRSDTPRARQSFSFWSEPYGLLGLAVQGSAGATVRATIRVRSAVIGTSSPIFKTLADGEANRITIPTTDYNRLVRYAQCATKVLDVHCFAGDASLPGWLTQREFVHGDIDRATSVVESLVSRWIGRDPAFELTPVGSASKPLVEHPSQSEPIVLFVGAAGVSQTIFLHCHGARDDEVRLSPTTEQRNKDTRAVRRCENYSRPNARSLERAGAFWAVYVEDERTPYDTTIDVEFGQALRDPDYEEFDPNAVAVEPDSSTKGVRTVRVGWRRFTMRDPPIDVQVAFSRQGPGYPLHQWVHVYHQRSRSLILPSGTMFVSTVPIVRHETTLASVYPGGGLQPSALVISQTEARRFVYAMVAVELPQIKAIADDEAAHKRLYLNLLPDFSAGIADTSMFFIGGSWRVPVWKERSYVTVGYTFTKQTLPRGGFSVGDRVSLATDPGAVIKEEKTRELRVGLSLEIIKLKW